MTPSVSLMIVADHRLFGECLASLLASHASLIVLAVVQTAEEALRQLRERLADVLLIDAYLPQTVALTLTQQLTQDFPHVRVLLLGFTRAEAETRAYVEAGASGYALGAPFHELISVIELVARGETMCSLHSAHAMFARLSELAGAAKRDALRESMLLSNCEREILRLIAEGRWTRERLQALSRQLLEAQEAERRRIARELHDEAGQLLASVHLALEEAVAGLPPPFRERFHPVRRHLDAIEVQLRRLSHELRPTILDDLGLLPALQFLVKGMAARTGLRIHLDSAIAGRLPPALETALYRIMQEGLTNVIKHAAATHVQLQLWQDARMVHGRLHDDGVGFAVDQVMRWKEPRGLGLLGIQERLEVVGGTLRIISAPGQGTTLCITLPFEPKEGSAGAGRT